jgi:hypothetical protein
VIGVVSGACRKERMSRFHDWSKTPMNKLAHHVIAYAAACSVKSRVAK